MSVKVTILYSEGCVHTPATIDLVKSISHQTSVNIALDVIQISDKSVAEELNFIGSPTVLVNGRDIDPAASGTKFTGFG